MHVYSNFVPKVPKTKIAGFLQCLIIYDILIKIYHEQKLHFENFHNIKYSEISVQVLEKLLDFTCTKKDPRIAKKTGIT